MSEKAQNEGKYRGGTQEERGIRGGGGRKVERGNGKERVWKTIQKMEGREEGEK